MTGAGVTTVRSPLNGAAVAERIRSNDLLTVPLLDGRAFADLPTGTYLVELAGGTLARMVRYPGGGASWRIVGSWGPT